MLPAWITRQGVPPWRVALFNTYIMLDFSDIPERTLKAIDDFAHEGTEPGGFVRAVLSNNLRDSFAFADSENRAALSRIVVYCFNEVPEICWGNPERVSAWIDFKRQQRDMEKVANKIK